jgi:hypothetical protein
MLYAVSLFILVVDSVIKGKARAENRQINTRSNYTFHLLEVVAPCLFYANLMLVVFEKMGRNLDVNPERHLLSAFCGGLLLAMVHHSLIGYILHLISKGVKKK